jgi:hypothetical protein
MFFVSAFLLIRQVQDHHAGRARHLVNAAFVIQQLLVGLLQPLALCESSATAPFDLSENWEPHGTPKVN